MVKHTLASYRVRGKTGTGYSDGDEVCRGGMYDVYKTEYIIDRTKGGAAEQFKTLYPGATKIVAELIKVLIA
jgi:hypothetical protein